MRRIRPRARIKPRPSGIAAHCDPSLCRDLPRVQRSRIIAGDAHVKPNREIRRRHYSPAFLAGATLTAASRRTRNAAADDCLSAPQGRDARGQPLVLSHRTRHQTPLLVSRRRERQDRGSTPQDAAASIRSRRRPMRRRAAIRRSGTAAAPNCAPCANRSPTPTPNWPPPQARADQAAEHRSSQATQRPCGQRNRRIPGAPPHRMRLRRHRSSRRAGPSHPAPIRPANLRSRPPPNPPPAHTARMHRPAPQPAAAARSPLAPPIHHGKGSPARSRCCWWSWSARWRWRASSASADLPVRPRAAPQPKLHRGRPARDLGCRSSCRAARHHRWFPEQTARDAREPASRDRARPTIREWRARMLARPARRQDRGICWRGWREARSPDEVERRLISRAGAAGRARTSSARCGVRA